MKSNHCFKHNKTIITFSVCFPFSFPLLCLGSSFSGRGFRSGPAHTEEWFGDVTGLELHPPARLRLVVSPQLGCFQPGSPLLSPSGGEDGGPDGPPGPAAPLCRPPAARFRRVFTERTEGHREGG